MSIAKNLKQIRQERGLTQEQVAEHLCVTRQTVSGYESGRTRPDVDTLVRLAEIYATDLDALLYGPQGQQNRLRRIRTAAWVLLGVSVFLALVSAALYRSVNLFFPVQEGRVPAELMEVMERRILLNEVWNVIDGLNLTLTGLGALVLLVLLLVLRCYVPWKEKMAFAGIWAGGILVVTLPFALTDGVFGAVNYLITPGLLIARILVVLLIGLGVDLFRSRRKEDR